jgi:transcriptional regulator with XRE-family HTH domain
MNLDLEAILEQMEAGKSQTEIAEKLSIGIATLSTFLNRDENADRSARARQSSAEAWLDKGLAVIKSSLRKDGEIDASAARAYAQECARRAAIRNPQYREKLDQQITGPGGSPLIVQVVRFADDPPAK